MGLRKSDFDLVDELVRVERSVVLVGAKQVVKQPKTAAGIRTVALPMWLVPLVEAHLRDYSALEPDSAVFVGPYGTLARPNFSSIWRRAITAVGLTRVDFHDLRHTGNHFAAISGASTRELMGRMGQLRVDAALVYQHRTASCDRAIADVMDDLVATWSAGQPALRQAQGPAGDAAPLVLRPAQGTKGHIVVLGHVEGKSQG